MEDVVQIVGCPVEIEQHHTNHPIPVKLTCFIEMDQQCSAQVTDPTRRVRLAAGVDRIRHTHRVLLTGRAQAHFAVSLNLLNF